MSTAKSRQACIWSIEALLGKSKRAYLWTFTTVDRACPRDVLNRWRSFERKCIREGLRMEGVRVVEPHPGGHGCHIHFVSRRFYDVNLVRTLSSSSGFGRIHVKPVPRHTALYVAKYVTKCRSRLFDDLPEYKGVRIWSCYGVKFASSAWVVRVRDVGSHSPFNRSFALVEGLTGSVWGDVCVADALARGIPYKGSFVRDGLERRRVVPASETRCIRRGRMGFMAKKPAKNADESRPKAKTREPSKHST